MSEQPMGGGAAFWAARGVRIEPEIAAEGDETEETELEDVPADVVEVEIGRAHV